MGFADSRLGSVLNKSLDLAKSYLSNNHPFLSNLSEKWGNFKERLAERNDNYNNWQSGLQERLGGQTGYDWATGLGSVMQAGAGLLGKKYVDDPGYMAEQSGIQAISSLGPQAALLGGAMSLSSAGLRAANLDATHINKNVGDAANMNTFERVGSNLVAGLNNSFFGLGTAFTTELDPLSISNEARALSGGYSNTFQKMLAYKDVAGKNALIGAGKLKSLGDYANTASDLMTSIGLDTEHKISSVPYNASMIESRNFRKINGMTGQNYGVNVGKQGMKMLSREELDRIYASRKQISNTSDDVQKFQNGGSILIPDGALHAHKHHMEDINPELAEDLTKKGIPVVSTDENGEVTQVAEIERQEIILEKSLTEKIEKLWKEGTEEAMIEAGKIITETLFTNCDDNANLVKEIE